MYELGDVETPSASAGSILDKLTSSFTTLAPALTQAYRERAILKAQLARAEAGLPALNINQMSPAVRLETTVGPTGDAKNLMLMAGVGVLALGGLWLLTRRRGRR